MSADRELLVWARCSKCHGVGSVRPLSGDPQDAEPCPVCKGDGFVAMAEVPPS